MAGRPSEQAARLTELGCELAQGHHERPMPANNLARRLTNPTGDEVAVRGIVGIGAADRLIRRPTTAAASRRGR